MKTKTFDREQIKQVIPHREPFLFLDAVLEIKVDSVRASKKVTHKECQGHFPMYPIFPGHLACEALAQAAAFLVLYHRSEMRQNGVNLAKIKEVKFLKPIFPGDEIFLEVRLIKARFGIYIFEGQIKLSTGEIAVEWQGTGVA